MVDIKPTGVILDQEQVEFITNGLDKIENPSQEAWERCQQVALDNGLEEFEQSDKKHYSFSTRWIRS